MVVCSYVPSSLSFYPFKVSTHCCLPYSPLRALQLSSWTIQKWNDCTKSLSFQEVTKIHPCSDAPLWCPLRGVHGHSLHSCVQCPLANTDALRDALQFFTGGSSWRVKPFVFDPFSHSYFHLWLSLLFYWQGFFVALIYCFCNGEVRNISSEMHEYVAAILSSLGVFCT